MTGINSAVTGKFSDPPVIMTGITSRFISRPVFSGVLVVQCVGLVLVPYTRGLLWWYSV